MTTTALTKRTSADLTFPGQPTASAPGNQASAPFRFMDEREIAEKLASYPKDSWRVKYDETYDENLTAKANKGDREFGNEADFFCKNPNGANVKVSIYAYGFRPKEGPSFKELLYDLLAKSSPTGFYDISVRVDSDLIYKGKHLDILKTNPIWQTLREVYYSAPGIESKYRLAVGQNRL